MNSPERKRVKNHVSNVGVFLSSLIFGVITFNLFSPIVVTEAEEESAGSNSSPFSTSISIDNKVAISVVPTGAQKVFESTSSVSYTNTCPAGFIVRISANSDNAALKRSGNDTYTKTIPTINAGTKLTDNTWGYSLDKGQTYFGLPTQDSPAVLLDTEEANASAKKIDVTFGVKVDNAIPSGTYSGDVLYTVTAKGDCFQYHFKADANDGTGSIYESEQGYGDTINLAETSSYLSREGYNLVGWRDGDTLFSVSETAVDVNPENKSSVTLVAEWEPVSYQISYNYGGGSVAMANKTSYTIETNTFTLTNPTRNGYAFKGWSGTGLTGSTNKTVTISKGSTGDRSYTANWTTGSQLLSDISVMQDMTTAICTNTAIGGSKTLTDARDSNTYNVRKLEDGQCWMTENLKLVNKPLNSDTSNLPDGETFSVPESSVRGFKEQNTNNAYVDDIYGGYYTFYTATAGWGTSSVISGETPKDICPRGWRLPTSDELTALVKKYKTADLIQGDPGFVLGGYVSNNTISNQGKYARYWSSTAKDESNAYMLSLGPSPSVSSATKTLGRSIHCIAK